VVHHTEAVQLLAEVPLPAEVLPLAVAVAVHMVVHMVVVVVPFFSRIDIVGS
jgi:hypothetical protein